jgi:hypothetical protein
MVVVGAPILPKSIKSFPAAREIVSGDDYFFHGPDQVSLSSS